MSNLVQLKQKARSFEQREQWQPALETYERMVEHHVDSDTLDVGVWNRIGDLRVRCGRPADAVAAYERAVDAYVGAGLHNNAIALCNKVLRLAPDRVAIHLRLGLISALKGFRSDARRHLGEYVEVMTRTGRHDEALDALAGSAEFADEHREDDQHHGELRRIVAEQLRAHGREAEALALLGTEPTDGGPEPLARLAEARHERAATEAVGTGAAEAAALAAPVDDAATEVGGASLEIRHDPDEADADPAHASPLPAPAALPDLELHAGDDGLLDLEVGEVDGLQITKFEFDTGDDDPASAGSVIPTVAPHGWTGEDAAGPADDLLISLPVVEHFGRTDDEAPEPAAPGTTPSDVSSDGFGADDDPGSDTATPASGPPHTALSDALEYPWEEETGATPEPEAEDDPGDEVGSSPLVLITGWEDVEAPTDDGEAGAASPVPAVPLADAAEQEVDLGDDPDADGPDAAGIDQPSSLPLLEVADAEAWDTPEAAAARGGEVGDAEADTPVSPAAALRTRIEADPRDRAAVDELAELLAAGGADAESLRVLDTACDLLAEQGGHAEAGAVVRALLRVQGPSTALLQRQVELADHGGDADTLVEAFLELARHLETDSGPEHARIVYERVLELDPDHPGARAALGFPPRADVEDEGYVDLAALILGDEPEPGGTRFVVEAEAPTGDEDHDFAEILARFREQVARNIAPDDATSHYDLGVAYKEMGLLDEAITEFQVALRAGANPLATLEMLGECFVTRDQHAVGRRVLDRAVRLSGAADAEMVGVLYWTGRCDEALGERGTAAEYYERVLAVDFRFRDTAERLRAMQEQGAALAF